MNPAKSPTLLAVLLTFALGLLSSVRASENTFTGWAVYLDQDFFIPGKTKTVITRWDSESSGFGKPNRKPPAS